MTTLDEKMMAAIATLATYAAAYADNSQEGIVSPEVCGDESDDDLRECFDESDFDMAVDVRDIRAALAVVATFLPKGD